MLKNKKFCSFYFIFFLSTIIFIFVPVKNVFASVSKISFITSPQNLDINQISGPIKVQTEDQNGATTSASETIYLNLSTSGNGEFSSNNSTWKSVATLPNNFSTSSIYISSSSASRVFYYEGFSSGQHIITVSAKSKSGIVFDNVSQIINVGIISTSSDQSATTSDSDNNSSTSSPDSNSSTSTASTTSNQNQNGQTTQIITRTVYISTHSGEEDLSDYSQVATFEVGAGRQRMALIGTPIGFTAKYSISNTSCTPSFSWSFGDGFDAVGKNVEHTYKYDGEYQVVLNGTCGEYNSTSRTTVEVITPEISIVNYQNGDLEIKNNGKTEINIGGWKIRGIQKDFVFPQDTIISAINKIILSKDDLNISSSTERVALADPSGSEVAYINFTNNVQGNSVLSSMTTANQATALSDNTTITVAEAESLVQQYKESLALKNGASFQAQPQKENITITNNNNDLNTNAGNNEAATVLESTNSSSTKSFLGKLIDIPLNGFKALVRMFYNF